MKAVPLSPEQLALNATRAAELLAALDAAEARPPRPTPVPDPEVEERFRAILARARQVTKPPPQTERQTRLSRLLKGVVRELAHTDVPTDALRERLVTVVKVARKADETAAPAAPTEEQHGDAAE